MIRLEDIKTVAVIGAGTMGQGIVQVFASAGYKTQLLDIESKLVDQAILAIDKNLNRAVEKGLMSGSDHVQARSNISACRRLTDVRAEVIIEAIAEKLEVKQNLFCEIEKITTPKTIFVTNTSSLSVTQIALKLMDPARCVGLHFFNPAHQMKLVEVIAGAATDPGLVTLMMELSRKTGKVPVSVKDSPGFIVNRVARHYYVESLRLLEENAADVPGIDRLLRSAGFKMGPYELMDLIGIDTNYAVTLSLHNAFLPSRRFMPGILQKQKIEDGHLGRKTGKGFYDYAKN